jgi:molybdopterin-guanine dinucleotide biosynthesis protein A
VAAADPHTRVGIDPAHITGVVLAGGRGTRMGGLDKGLQLFEGLPLAQQALQRLQKQVGPTMINANRHLDQYRAFGVPVWPDVLPGYAGPLAGFVTALQHCHTPYLVTVPCDTPRFPTDLVQQLALALVRADSVIAVASTLDEGEDGQSVWRPQPVFCLLHTRLRTSLEQFTARGGRKVEAWTAQHNAVHVPFDNPPAFFNVNTLAQLQALRS